jgi:hypothetical protein
MFALPIVCRAGTEPNRRPVITDAKSVNPSTHSLPAGGFKRVISAGRRVLMAFRPHIATPSPSAPPLSASSRFSVSICRNRRRRLAPSAIRRATSFCREADLASSRFPTLAHAISKTNVTAPKSTTKTGLVLPTKFSASGSTNAPTPAFVSAYCWASRFAIRFASVWARFRVASRRRRPMA